MIDRRNDGQNVRIRDDRMIEQKKNDKQKERCNVKTKERTIEHKIEMIESML